MKTLTNKIRLLIILMLFMGCTVHKQKEAINESIIGNWRVLKIDRLKTFNMDVSLDNSSVFGSEAWNSSIGKTMVFKSHNLFETTIVERNGSPVELFYNYITGKNKLIISLEKDSLDKSFECEVKLNDKTMILILDEYLAIELHKI